MKVLVIFESMYGNTRHVAEAIAQGIGEAAAVTIVAAADAWDEDLTTYDLVVVGGPPRARHEQAHHPPRRSGGGRETRQPAHPRT